MFTPLRIGASGKRQKELSRSRRDAPTARTVRFHRHRHDDDDDDIDLTARNRRQLRLNAALWNRNENAVKREIKRPVIRRERPDEIHDDVVSRMTDRDAECFGFIEYVGRPGASGIRDLT